jgi:hypothetical protein
MKARSTLFIVLLLIVPIIIIAIWLFSGKDLKDICEEDYNYLIDLEFIGVVNKKYIDNQNHGAKTLDILATEGITKWPIAADRSGCYEYLSINDSIVKEIGSYDVFVYRNQVLDTIFKIDYKCDE